MTSDKRNLTGREVCRYCGALIDTPHAVPFGIDVEPATFHAQARCVEPVEPIR